jgi:transposase-like protein
VRAGTSFQRDAVRARIILAAAGGGSSVEVARGVGVHPRTVERWRARFRRYDLAGLQDKPRPGPPLKFGPVARLELMALACEPIPGRAGKATRTIAELTHEAAARGLVEAISWVSVRPAQGGAAPPGTLRPGRWDGHG